MREVSATARVAESSLILAYGLRRFLRVVEGEEVVGVGEEKK